MSVRIPKLGSTEMLANIDLSSIKSKEWKFMKMRNIPRRKPKSPIRFTIKAFLPALAFSISSNQNPISKYEQSPTPSQPINKIGRLAPRIRMSMEAVNIFKYVK